jgi:16S rRNA C1402 (ribose-2'-O) methylase RsmI
MAMSKISKDDWDKHAMAGARALRLATTQQTDEQRLAELMQKAQALIDAIHACHRNGQLSKAAMLKLNDPGAELSRLLATISSDLKFI